MQTSLFPCVTLIIIINGLVCAMPTAHDDQGYPDIFSAYISPVDQHQFNPATSTHQLPELMPMNTESKDADPNGLPRTTELRVIQPNVIKRTKHQISAIRARKIASPSIHSDEDSTDHTTLPLIFRPGSYRSATY